VTLDDSPPKEPLAKIDLNGVFRPENLAKKGVFEGKIGVFGGQKGPKIGLSIYSSVTM
jgi:hypothetical protein